MTTPRAARSRSRGRRDPRCSRPPAGHGCARSPRCAGARATRDGGRRLHRVLDTGDGRRFVPVAAGLLTGTPLRVDLRTLPGDSRARLRVIATDRVLTGSDDSDRLRRVPVKAPSVQIAAPAAKSEVIAGEPISQLAFVSDLQDVPFPAARVVWESSLQGRLGSGGAITPTLAPGTHVITVRATNRERQVGHRDGDGGCDPAAAARRRDPRAVALAAPGACACDRGGRDRPRDLPPAGRRPARPPRRQPSAPRSSFSSRSTAAQERASCCSVTPHSSPSRASTAASRSAAGTGR